MIKKAQITIDSKQTLDLKIIQPTIGTDAVFTENLFKELGIFTFDSSAMSAAICQSKITYIDGAQGILRYRGFAIEDIAEHADFLETCYLLLYGEKGTDIQINDFKLKVNEQSELPTESYKLIESFNKNSHPMTILSASVLQLARNAENDSSNYQKNPEKCNEVAINLIAKVPLLTANIYRYLNNLAFTKSDNNLSYGENFMSMLNVENLQTSNLQKLANFMEKIFILHADHGQNASTFTVRAVGSTKANPYACIASGICSLFGPSHGGANEKVINMLNQIGHVNNIDKFLAKTKDPQDPFLLMGFGHRVYKNFDPRAKILKRISDEILQILDSNAERELFKIASALEKKALQDPYFKERNLYPNVDFYSGIILSAMNIPTIMFTPIFALARTIGWITHWKEMITEEEKIKIFRPRQIYTGEQHRKY